MTLPRLRPRTGDLLAVRPRFVAAFGLFPPGGRCTPRRSGEALALCLRAGPLLSERLVLEDFWTVGFAAAFVFAGDAPRLRAVPFALAGEVLRLVDVVLVVTGLFADLVGALFGLGSRTVLGCVFAGETLRLVTGTAFFAGDTLRRDWTADLTGDAALVAAVVA